jgi:hypothetical protein
MMITTEREPLELPWRDGFDAIREAIWKRKCTHFGRDWRPRRFVADVFAMPDIVKMRDADFNQYAYQPAIDPRGATFMGQPIEFSDAPELRGKLILEFES